MDTQYLTKLLTERLIAIIQADYTALLDIDNKLKSVVDMTPEQKDLVDMVDSKGIYTMSKSKAIDLLSKIAGLNSSTTKLESDTPFNISFAMDFVKPKSEGDDGE